MNIHFITSLESHGAEKQLLNLIKTENSAVISIIGGDLKQSFKKYSELIILKDINLKKFFKLLILIYKSKTFNIWLYHFLIPISSIALFLNKELKIYTRQDIEPRRSLTKFQKSSLIYTKFLSYFYRNKIILIANSKRSLKSHIKFGLHYKSAYIVSNKIDKTFFNNELTRLKKNDKQINILTLARFDISKNIPLELSIMEMINEIYDFNFKLEIIGDNISQIIKGGFLINKPNWLSLKDGIKVTPEIFDKYDFYLCLSLWEGQSNSIHEAASRGIHLITTENGDSDLVAKNCEGKVLKNNSDYIKEIGNLMQNSESIFKKKKDRREKYINFYKNII